MLFTTRTSLCTLTMAMALIFAAACGDDETGSGGTTTTSSDGGNGGSNTSGGGGATGGTTNTGGSNGGMGGMGGMGSGGMAAFAVSVPNHTEGDTWASTYECPNCNNGGTQTSPELNWTAGPAGTMSYAVVMRDLDFMNGFVHWAIWDIPVGEMGLSEGIPAGFDPGAPAPAGCKQAQGYLGMCSCNSVNTYEFTVYAMPDTTLGGLTMGSSKAAAAAAIEAAAIASVTISGES